MRVAKFYIAFFLILVILAVGLVLIFFKKPVLEISPSNSEVEIAEKEPVSSSPKNDLEIAKAIYLTSWSAAKSKFIDYLIDIAKTTEINAAVIDIKDFSGYVGYDTTVPEVEKYKAEQIRIKNINELVQKLHKENIYVIARITVFQDPLLARARPDLAIKSKKEPTAFWFDNAGLAWIDPAARESWDYNIAIAKDAAKIGFDEINFDYVRFPSDGDLQDMVFPFWDGKVPKNVVIREFFKYLRQELSGIKISIDLFGLSTVSSDDLGVGQIIEDGFEYFDYVCPMIYPSHYAVGFIGYENPAEYPYEVVKYSMEGALNKLQVYKKTGENNAKLRPWLQDFDLGAEYNAKMVRLEIKAVYDSAGNNFNGFLLWSSWNYYTREALEPE